MSSFIAIHFIAIFLAFVVIVLVYAPQTEAAQCDCNFAEKGAEVCGSNGVTYINRCEFACLARDYMKLGRRLAVAKEGKCWSGSASIECCDGFF